MRDCTICVAKTKVLIRFAGTAKQGPVSSKCLRQDFVLENVPGRFKDKSRVSSNSRNLGSSQILS